MKKLLTCILLLLLSTQVEAAYVAATNAAGGSGTDSVTITVPTHSNGDVIGCLLESHGETVTWGFTAATSGTFTVAGGAGRAGTFSWATRIASGEPGNYTISIGGGNGLTLKAACFSLSGRSSATPSASASTNDAGASSTPISTPLTGVTAASGDDIVVVTGTAALGTSTGPMTFTAPTDYTTRATQELTGNAFTAGAVAIATRDNVSSGATGTLTGTWTYATGIGDTAGAVLAFASSGGGGSSPVPLIYLQH